MRVCACKSSTISAWDGVPAVAISSAPASGSCSSSEQNFGEMRTAGEARNVGGIGGPAEAAQDAVNPGGCPFGQRREGNAGFAQMVGDKGADAAGMGDDGNPASRWRRGVSQQMRRLDKIVVVFAARHPKLAKQSVVHFVGARQRRRVGAGGGSPDVGTPHLDERDFLAQPEGLPSRL